MGDTLNPFNLVLLASARDVCASISMYPFNKTYWRAENSDSNCWFMFKYSFISSGSTVLYLFTLNVNIIVYFDNSVCFSPVGLIQVMVHKKYYTVHSVNICLLYTSRCG